MEQDRKLKSRAENAAKGEPTRSPTSGTIAGRVPAPMVPADETVDGDPPSGSLGAEADRERAKEGGGR